MCTCAQIRTVCSTTSQPDWAEKRLYKIDHVPTLYSVEDYYLLRPNIMKTYPLIALASAPTAYAWGTLGHDTVAYIASNFVKSSTQAWAQGILGDTSADYLANVATWADSYRYTAAGKFSAPYHYIDAEDNPPSSCNVDYNRDCGTGGCSVSAIANYTQRVQSSSLSTTQVNYALRFLVHFLGDITQPLHDEAIDVGGNDIDVTYANKDNNLHHIWVGFVSC